MIPGLFNASAILATYLVASIPFGVIFTNIFSGIDVRSVGSGNIGATNVLRAAGKKAAILTLLADAIKGYLPVLLCKVAFHDDVTTASAAAAAYLGHCYPVYLKFKGGKGVATGFGVMLAVNPALGAFSLCIWLVAAFIWKYSSLAAVLAFTCYPLATFFTT
jgi:glycerol-3-phosphate acyltransferase PlsY